MKCRAITGKRPNEYGFVNIECGQTVGTRSYWAGWHLGPILVAYCAREGHERSVRVRFAEVPFVTATLYPLATLTQNDDGSMTVTPEDLPEPRWLHEDPDFIDHDATERYTDAIDAAKWTADRNETDAGWTVGELMEGYGK